MKDFDMLSMLAPGGLSQYAADYMLDLISQGSKPEERRKKDREDAFRRADAAKNAAPWQDQLTGIADDSQSAIGPAQNRGAMSKALDFLRQYISPNEFDVRNDQIQRGVSSSEAREGTIEPGQSMFSSGRRLAQGVIPGIYDYASGLNPNPNAGGILSDLALLLPFGAASRAERAASGLARSVEGAAPRVEQAATEAGSPAWDWIKRLYNESALGNEMGAVRTKRPKVAPDEMALGGELQYDPKAKRFVAGDTAEPINDIAMQGAPGRRSSQANYYTPEVRDFAATRRGELVPPVDNYRGAPAPPQYNTANRRAAEEAAMNEPVMAETSSDAGRMNWDPQTEQTIDDIISAINPSAIPRRSPVPRASAASSPEAQAATRQRIKDAYQAKLDEVLAGTETEVAPPQSMSGAARNWVKNTLGMGEADAGAASTRPTTVSIPSVKPDDRELHRFALEIKEWEAANGQKWPSRRPIWDSVQKKYVMSSDAYAEAQHQMTGLRYKEEELARAAEEAAGGFRGQNNLDPSDWVFGQPATLLSPEMKKLLGLGVIGGGLYGISKNLPELTGSMDYSPPTYDEMDTILNLLGKNRSNPQIARLRNPAYTYQGWKENPKDFRALQTNVSQILGLLPKKRDYGANRQRN